MTTTNDPGFSFTGRNTALVWPKTGESIAGCVTRARRDVRPTGRSSLILTRRPDHILSPLAA